MALDELLPRACGATTGRGTSATLTNLQVLNHIMFTTTGYLKNSSYLSLVIERPLQYVSGLVVFIKALSLAPPCGFVPSSSMIFQVNDAIGTRIPTSPTAIFFMER